MLVVDGLSWAAGEMIEPLLSEREVIEGRKLDWVLSSTPCCRSPSLWNYPSVRSRYGGSLSNQLIRSSILVDRRVDPKTAPLGSSGHNALLPPQEGEMTGQDYFTTIPL